MKFINSTLHGLLDYAAALALIIAPYLLGLDSISSLAHWMSIAAGAGLIVYSLVTDYYYAFAKIIPFKVHLGLDLAAAVFFLVAPSVFGFTGIVQIYYWVMGAGVIAVVALTTRVPASE